MIVPTYYKKPYKVVLKFYLPIYRFLQKTAHLAVTFALLLKYLFFRKLFSVFKRKSSKLNTIFTIKGYQ